MFWARNGGKVTDSVFILLNHLYLIGKMGSCNSVNRTCSITSCNHFSSEGITIWSKQLNKHRHVVLLLMKLNVAQIYTGHTEFTSISLEGFSSLKPKMCGLWNQDCGPVGWLCCFPNRKSDYSLHTSVTQRNFLFRTSKVLFPTCLCNPCLSEPLSPLRGLLPPFTLGCPKALAIISHHDFRLVRILSPTSLNFPIPLCGMTKLQLVPKGKDPGTQQTSNK